jgi:hypothetical protein
MGLISVTAHVAGTVLTAAALNNNDNAILNQVNGNLETVNYANLSVTAAILASSAVTTAKLDVGVLLGLSTVTAVSTDYVAISDTSDSGNAKKALISDISPAAATQAQMEAASSNVVMVTPLSLNWHPGVSKAWCSFNGTGAPAMIVRYNMDASITDNGVGDWTVSITTDFSSGSYCMTSGVLGNSGDLFGVTIKAGTTPAAGSVNVTAWNSVGGAVDLAMVNLDFKGDQ